MLHPVTIVPGEVVGKKGIGAWFVLRQLAKHRLLFAHQLLYALEVDVKLGICLGMSRDTDRLRLATVCQPRYLEGPGTKLLNSAGLSMRYCRLGAVKLSASEVGKSCVAIFQSDPLGMTNVTCTGRSLKPSAYTTVAEKLM